MAKYFKLNIEFTKKISILKAKSVAEIDIKSNYSRLMGEQTTWSSLAVIYFNIFIPASATPVNFNILFNREFITSI